MPAQFLAVSSVIKKPERPFYDLMLPKQRRVPITNEFVIFIHCYSFAIAAVLLFNLSVGLWFGHLQIAGAHHIKDFFPDFILFNQD